MLSRRVKAAYYVSCAPLMWANGLIYRWTRAPRNGLIRVHLGPGQKNYLPNWINVDANMFTGRCDVWADLRDPLPFHDGSVSAFYSHHVIEHLPDLTQHFREVYRCLRPGGVYRVGGPNGDAAIAKFTENDSTWFGDYPVARKSIGGRFENFIFCSGEHVTILTQSFLGELLADAGFEKIRACLPVTESHHPSLFSECLDKEWESTFDCPHTLIVEAEKPAARE